MLKAEIGWSLSSSRNALKRWRHLVLSTLNNTFIC
jgi:hypothetical protein